MSNLDPKILYVIFTYNRPTITSKCFTTLFHPNNLRPDRVVIIDDGSVDDLKNSLTFNQLANNKNYPIDFFSIGKNIGYANCFDLALKIVDVYNPTYVYFIESDYIFRPTGLKTIQWLFENNEIAKQAIGFSGYDNPDFYDSRKRNMFIRLITEQFEFDNVNRNILYTPFKVSTPEEEVQVEFVSNSCGTIYLNWEKVKELRQAFSLTWKQWERNLVQKHKENYRILDDGVLSHGLSWMWNEYAKGCGIDRNKYAALLNVKPSVANHVNGGGLSISGKTPENFTTARSPTWKDV